MKQSTMESKEFMQGYKEKLDALSSAVLRAYLDSVMFLIIVPIATDKRKISNFLFDYSFYSIRERAIISAKSLIEPEKKDRLTLEKVIKNLQKYKEYKQYADEIHLKYKELFTSEEAIRVKDFRDSLCHNLTDDSKVKIYCDDILFLIDSVMKILDDIYKKVFNIRNENFKKIMNLSKTLADDYWGAICAQADKVPNRNKELLELQKMLSCY